MAESKSAMLARQVPPHHDRSPKTPCLSLTCERHDPTLVGTISLSGDTPVIPKEQTGTRHQNCAGRSRSGRLMVLSPRAKRKSFCGTPKPGGSVSGRVAVERMVLSVPVAPTHSLADLRDEADDIVCLEDHEFFDAIGAYYADFSQVSDETVVEVLKRFSVRQANPVTLPAG